MHLQKLVVVFTIVSLTIASCNNSPKLKPQSDSNQKDKVATSTEKWWKGSNIYEVNLRQYSSEGTIEAFARSLPRLKDMGVDILWFMPITPIGIEGRKENAKQMGSYYAVRDYKAFNPDYGTMQQWKAFVQQAHSMGFKVITDWVANHTAPDNPWIKSNPDFYTKDSLGKMIAPFDWTDVRELNYDNRAMRDSMLDAMKFWLTTGIDGFRCDVAAEVPNDFWKNCITQLKALKPDIFMLAEADKPELHTAGFDVTYGWQAMHAMKELYTGKYNLLQFDSVMNSGLKEFPANAARLFFTTNHDENSWNGTEYEKFGNAAPAFAVLTQTFAQSIPLIYSGQEMPNKRRLKFFVKDSIRWTGQYALAPFYKKLLLLRHSNDALNYDATYKRLNSSNNNAVYAYVREKAGKKVVVILNFSKQEQKFSIDDAVINGEPYNVFMAVNEKIDTKHTFNIEPWGYIVYEYK
ncbi:MAG TPA: alpha-amylase family glycosyl hydrolase [Ferruginibacter sp.]|nr:alpha-amylase family glycosyl hydrolase [Ferruginibacter sp.]HRE62478.1 alpha-amylase family glycosyl hydrolase [Ferruginibacter sp.]